MTAPAISVLGPWAILLALHTFAFVLTGPLHTSAPPPGPGTAGALDPVQPSPAIGAMIALGLMAAFAVPHLPYVVAVRRLQRLSSMSPRVLLGATVVLALAGIWMYPRFGTDIFYYAFRLRQWLVYGENPLTAPVESHPDDPLYELVWVVPGVLPAYGPFWYVLAWVPAALGGSSIFGLVLSFKALAAVSYATVAWLIWRCTGGRPVHERWSAVVFFAWNPLVLFDVLGKGHNDIVIAVPILGALLLLRHPIGSSLCLATAVLVKASALLAGPPLLRALLHQRVSFTRLALAGCASAVLVILAFLPFWEGPTTLAPLLAQAGRVVWSPGTLFILASQAVGIEAGTPIRLLLTASTVLLAAQLWRLQQPTRESAAWAMAHLGAWGMALLTTAFFAHYLVPSVALAAVAQDRRLQVVIATFAAASMAAYAAEAFSLVFGAAWTEGVGNPLFGTLVTFVPPLIALVWTRRASGGPVAREVPASARAPR